MLFSFCGSKFRFYFSQIYGFYEILVYLLNLFNKIHHFQNNMDNINYLTLMKICVENIFKVLNN